MVKIANGKFDVPIGLRPGSHALSMSPHPKVSLGFWPLEMRAETAAAYCDEPSVEAFLDKISRGIYPEPIKEKGCLPKWHRGKLDRVVARRHRVPFDNIALAEDASE